MDFHVLESTHANRSEKHKMSAKVNGQTYFTQLGNGTGKYAYGKTFNSQVVF